MQVDMQNNNINMETEVMNESKLVKVKFVMDKSGSMSSMGDEPRQSLNNFISKQKEDGEFLFSLTLFSDNVLFSKVNISSKELSDFKEGDIVTGGMTALYDAIGETIESDPEDDSDVIFIILTDGLENASRKYTRSQIRKMVKEKEAKGWKFIYLGANQDSYAESNNIGLNAGVSYDYEANVRGLNRLMTTVSDTVRCMRTQSFDPRPSQEKDVEDLDTIGDLPTFAFSGPLLQPNYTCDTAFLPSLTTTMPSMQRFMTEGPNL